MEELNRWEVTFKTIGNTSFPHQQESSSGFPCTTSIQKQFLPYTATLSLTLCIYINVQIHICLDTPTHTYKHVHASRGEREREGGRGREEDIIVDATSEVIYNIMCALLWPL